MKDWKVLRRFVILFVNFILGGVAGISLFAFFRTILATLAFVIPVVLFALIYYKDRNAWNTIPFVAGAITGFAFVLYVLFQLFAGVPGLSGM